MASRRTKVAAGFTASAAILLTMIVGGVKNANEAKVRGEVADRFAQRKERPLTIQERDAWFAVVNADLKRCPTHKFEVQDPDAMLEALNEIVRNGC